jgi:hypothetical protein
MMPGMKPSKVSRILNQKCPLKPTSRNTPNGGNKIANKILIGSVAVKAMVITFYLVIIGLCHGNIIGIAQYSSLTCVYSE